jgi:hypothetical protein
MPNSEISASATVSEKLERDLRDLLQNELGTAGAYDIVVHPDADHEGDPIVVVQVKHRLVNRPIHLKEVADADRAARDLAWGQGERRFVLVDHIYDEKQKVAGAN